MKQEAIDRVIKEGIRLFGLQNLSEEMVLVWINYSNNILDIVSNNSMIKYQYRMFVSELRLKGVSPHELQHRCVEFLIQSIPNL